MLEAVIATLPAIPLEFVPLLLHGNIYLKYDDRALQTHGKAIMESQVSCQDYKTILQSKLQCVAIIQINGSM